MVSEKSFIETNRSPEGAFFLCRLAPFWVPKYPFRPTGIKITFTKGGTLAATLGLIQKNFDDVKVVEAAFLIELDFLKGREKLKDTPVHAMIHY